MLGTYLGSARYGDGEQSQRQLTAQEYIRNRRPFLFSLKDTQTDATFSVLAFPLEATVQTLGIAPLQLYGYGFIVRDVKVFGEWDRLNLFRFAHTHSFNLEAAHLFRGESICLEVGSKYCVEEGLISLTHPENNTHIALTDRQTRNRLKTAIVDEFYITTELLEWDQIHVFEVVPTDE